jgi:hypothetical protein
MGDGLLSRLCTDRHSLGAPATLPMILNCSNSFFRFDSRNFSLTLPRIARSISKFQKGDP